MGSSRMGRRHWLKLVGASSAASVLPAGFFGCAPGCEGPVDGRSVGRFGPLRPDPEGLLDLPEGFSYRVLSRAGRPLPGGFRLPALPDGMGCFEGPQGSWVLLRNHEVSTMQPSLGPLPDGRMPPPEAFDPNAHGGVSRLQLRPGSLDVQQEHLVLAGTERNCAGGRTPWGWVSCEETAMEGHGWAFLTRPEWDRLVPPERLTALGRFYREAIAFDPVSGVTYQTEDRTDGCLYRYLPERPEAPFGAGRLQAMRAIGRPRFSTAEGMRVGDTLEVDWVDVPDPSARHEPTRAQAVRLGAAVVRRGEGIDWDARHGRLWFAATAGGPLQLGQFFVYRPEGTEGGTLTLLAQAEAPMPPYFEMPDNLVVAPWGELVFCEDGPGHDFVRVLHADGTVSDLVRQARDAGEVTGVCFAPDGSTMFFNVQHLGLTVAVQGPFPRPVGA